MNAADPRDLQALPERHRLFWDEAAPLLPADHMMCDPFRTLAFGTDASFYRLVPRIVAKVRSREEVTRLLALADRHAVPVTFRAAGTSLSGQAVTDSVLLVLAGGWRGCAVHDGGALITLEPGVIGAEANAAPRRPRAQDRPGPGLHQLLHGGRHRRQQRRPACAAARRRTATRPWRACSSSSRTGASSTPPIPASRRRLRRRPPGAARRPLRHPRRDRRRRRARLPHPREVPDQEHDRLRPQRLRRLPATRSTSSSTS